MLQLSASSDAWPGRRPCLIVVPKTAKSVAVVIKGGAAGGAGKNREWTKTASSAVPRCRYGETKKVTTRRGPRRYAEQDIKWLGRCEAGATWARSKQGPAPRKVVRGRRRRRRSEEDARFVIEVTDGGGDGGGAAGGEDDRVLELRYSTADTNAVQQQKQQQQPRNMAGERPTRTACDGRPPPSSSARLSSRRAGFVLGGEGEDGECAVTVHLGHAYKLRLKFFTSAAETKGERERHSGRRSVAFYRPLCGGRS